MEAELALRSPIRATLVDCCARAASGHTIDIAEAPPRRVMKSRRII
jgi:hypothetical protein